MTLLHIISHRLTRIAAMAAIVAASAATSMASNSQFADGHWVKIKVSDTGLQQITYDQLRQWGFDHPENVTVWGYGGVPHHTCWTPTDLPNDLPQQHVLHTSDSRILFYGESGWRHTLLGRNVSSTLTNRGPGVLLEINNASLEGYYFITDSRPAKETTPIKYFFSTTEIIDSHDCVMSYFDEATLPNGLGQNYWGNDITAMPDQTLSLQFDLPDRCTTTAAGNEIYATYVVAGAGTNSSMSYAISNGNGTTAKSATVTLGTTNKETTGQVISDNSRFITTTLNADIDLLKVKFYPPSSTSRITKWAALDHFAFLYPRTNRFTGGQQTIYIRDSKADERVTFTDFDNNTMVWNIESPYDVRPYECRRDETLRFTVPKAYNLTRLNTYGRILIFDSTAQHYAVEYAGTVTDSGICDVDNPDMVIIATPMLRQQAERLAQIHRDLLGHNVAVVDQEDIFNEYSSGTPTPNALRRYMQDLYRRPGSNLKYLLLFGPTSNDLRGQSGAAAFLKSQGNLLMSYPVYSKPRQLTATSSFNSDSYFGTLSDISSEDTFLRTTMDIGVGRIPAQDQREATEAVDKIYQYLTEPPYVDSVNRAILLSEAGDSHQHLNNSETVASQFSSSDPSTTKIKIYNSFYTRLDRTCPSANQALSQALQMGAGYFNFSGHGRPDQLTMLNVWNTSDVKSTDYTVYPFGMLATCESYTFDLLENSILDRMVLQPNGGLIAAIGAGRSVYGSRNQILNAFLSNIYASAKGSLNTGDLLRQAFNGIIASTTENTLMINNRCYNLCGDPALPLYTAERDRVKITSIDGNTMTSASMTITPLESHTISGAVYTDDTASEIDTSFNGSIILTLYDSPRTIHTTDLKDSATTENEEINKDILIDEDQLISVKAEVVDGKWETHFVSPSKIRPADGNESHAFNRLTMLAVSSDNLTRIKGSYTNISLSDELPDEVADVTAPVVDQMWIDSPDFADGDAVGSEISINAHILSDESGIKVVTGGIGGATRIVIDGQRIIPVLGSALSFNTDGTTDINVTVSSLVDGHHTATLYISDNVGNTASHTISFTVVNDPGSPVITVKESPARTQATFVMSHNFSGNPTGRLIIEDAAGATIVSRENVDFGSEQEWDLTLDGTTPAPDGVYYVYAIVNTGRLYGATPKQAFTIVQK